MYMQTCIYVICLHLSMYIIYLRTRTIHGYIYMYTYTYVYVHVLIFVHAYIYLDALRKSVTALCER